MSGLNLAALLIAAFLAGAYLALFVRALFEESTRRRIANAAQDALTPDALARLREYIAAIDKQTELTLERDITGSPTTVFFPPPR